MPRLASVLVLLLGFVAACARGVSPPSAPQTRAAERDRPVSEIDALVAFARMYGYVRFFHPTDRAAEADWQQLAAQGVAYVRDARTVGELDERLGAFFSPYAPRLAHWVGDEPEPAADPVPRPRDGLVFWQYQGFVGTPVSLYRPPYERVRVGGDPRARRRYSEMPERAETIQATLADDIHVRLPLVLCTEDAGAGGATSVDLDPEVGALAHDLDGHRALDVRQGAVVEVWNVLRHYYPYQDAVDGDWHALLAAALADAVDDASRQDVADTLGGLVRAVRDGHGEVGHPRLRQRALPFRVELVQGQAVVTATEDPQRVAVGDVVVAIDGERMLDRIAGIVDASSGSEQWRWHKAAAWLSTMGRPDDVARVLLQRDGRRWTIEAEYGGTRPPEPDRPATLHTFDDGTIYVDLTRIDSETLRAEIETLAAAPGVVFDMRGYPDNTHFIIDHLLSEPEDALWLHVPKILAPDGEVAAWHRIGWHRRPAEPRITGKVAFLVSPAAISYAESILGYVEAHRLGTLVGAPSAGTNGDIVRLDTLAGYHVIFTGMQVTRHDGSPFHLQGVAPDVPASATIAGLREGRDEVLEAGLHAVRADPGTVAANPAAVTP